MNTFRLLWKMVNEIEEQDKFDGKDRTGTIVSRYSDIIDDILHKTGYSRNPDTLMVFTDEQLKEEIEERKHED